MENSLIKFLKNLAYPFCIVSTRYKDLDYAIIVSSLNSVSLDPSSILVCIHKTASIAKNLKEHFYINIIFSGP